VSFDAGDHWQPLQLNLPRTSMRDLAIHGDDLIVGTHGRSFWILDDITPLRQLSEKVARAEAYLYAPEEAVRLHRDRNPDTPLPPETPAGKNPPDGAVVDYYLAKTAGGAVTLEILDGAGKLVRKYSSTDKPQTLEEIAPKHPIPMYWVREDQVLSGQAGMHRFVWNVRYAPPKSLSHGYPISAIPHDTPQEPQGAWAAPGKYTLKLTVDGKSYTQPLTVKMDPRVKSSPAELQKQFEMQQMAASGMNRSFVALEELHTLREQVGERMGKAGAELKAKLTDFDKKAAELEGAAVQGFFGTPLTGRRPENFSTLNQRFHQVLAIADSADRAPTLTAAAAAQELETALKECSERWATMKNKDVVELNGLLEKEKLLKLNAEEKKSGEPSSDDDGDDEP
jgi:hypothetical protein